MRQSSKDDDRLADDIDQLRQIAAKHQQTLFLGNGGESVMVRLARLEQWRESHVESKAQQVNWPAIIVPTLISTITALIVLAVSIAGSGS